VHVGGFIERERRILAFRLLLPLKAPCTPPTRPARPRCQPPLPVPQRAAGPPRRPSPPQPPHIPAAATAAAARHSSPRRTRPTPQPPSPQQSPRTPDASTAHPRRRNRRRRLTAPHPVPHCPPGLSPSPLPGPHPHASTTPGAPSHGPFPHTTHARTGNLRKKKQLRGPLRTPKTHHAQRSSREGNAAQRRQMRVSDALHTDNIIQTGSSTDVHTYRHITHRYIPPPPRPHPRAPPTPAPTSPGSPPSAPPPPGPFPLPARCRGKKGESRTWKRQRAPSRGRGGTLRGRTRRRRLSATSCADLPPILPGGHEVPLGQEAPTVVAEGCLSDCLETANDFTWL